MNNLYSKLVTVLASTFLSVWLYAPTTHAGVVGDSNWLVEKGDTVYAIARKVFPEDKVKQKQFRQALIKNNPDIFQGDANLLSIGTLLRLPGFAVAKPVVEVVPEPESIARSQQEPVVLAEPVVVVPEPEEVAEPAVVVPDPEETIGKVLINVGNLEAVNRGITRALSRNSKVFKGDTLTTANNAYTQIRMKDGALLSLRPKTKLLISDYNFNGAENGTEKSFFELVSGGFRTITGLIGRTYKNNYRVKTAMATIGIRGTHYGLMLCDSGSCKGEKVAMNDGLYGGVIDGSVLITNDSGEFAFDNDQYFHVASNVVPPIEQLKPPPVFHGKNEGRNTRVGEEKSGKVQAEQIGLNDKLEGDGKLDKAGGKLKPFIVSQGGVGHLPPRVDEFIGSDLPVLNDQNDNPLNNTPTVITAPNGSGMLVGFTGEDSVTTAVDNIAAGIAISPTNNNQIILGYKTTANGTTIGNIPVAVQEFSEGVQHTLALPGGVAVVKDIGGSPLGVNWGRWDGNYVLTENGVPQQTFGSLHYVYSDNLTTAAQLTALGGLLTTETYTVAGGTTPTNSLGAQSSLIDITVQSNFQTRMIENYQIHVQDGVAAAPVDFIMENSAPVSFVNMTEFDLVDSGLKIGSVPTCAVTCQGQAGAAFVGQQAEGIITTYSISEVGGPKGANGAAVLTRSGGSSPAQ